MIQPSSSIIRRTSRTVTTLHALGYSVEFWLILAERIAIYPNRSGGIDYPLNGADLPCLSNWDALDYSAICITIRYPLRYGGPIAKGYQMSTISVNLPDSVMLEVAQRAQKNGFSDVGEFVSQMIAQINERQTQVEKLAIEGIESGPSEPWSTAEIEAIRNDLRSKHGN